MGRFFKSANEVYDVYEKFFKRLFNDPHLGKKIITLGKTFNLKFTDYNTEITIIIDGENYKFVRGASEKIAEIVLWLNSDSAHRLCSGKTTPLSAIMSREIRAKGPIRALTDIDTIFSAAKTIYRTVLEEMGRTDLLD